MVKLFTTELIKHYLIDTEEEIYSFLKSRGYLNSECTTISFEHSLAMNKYIVEVRVLCERS